MISPKCAALFPEKPNHHNLQSSQRNLILQNCYSKSFKTKRSQKSSQTCHFNSTFVINWYFTDFFTNENPRKFVEKQKMIFFYIFHVYLDKRGRLPKERLPQKTIAQGEFWPRKFSPRRLLSRKTLFAKETLFFSKKISTSLEPLCNKEHPMTKHVVWGRVLTKQKSDTWWLF